MPWAEAAVHKCPSKWENTCVGISLSPATLLKRDSNTGTLMWILQNF